MSALDYEPQLLEQLTRIADALELSNALAVVGRQPVASNELSRLDPRPCEVDEDEEPYGRLDGKPLYSQCGRGTPKCHVHHWIEGGQQLAESAVQTLRANGGR